MDNESITKPKGFLPTITSTSSQSTSCPLGQSTDLGCCAKQIDIYRDSPIRFLGYANEVGEAFRALVHVNFVRASYVVAFAYVAADTFDKGQKTSKKTYATGEEKQNAVMIKMGDTVVWQSLASVFIPGLVINRFCKAAHWALTKGARFGGGVAKPLTTILGLSLIPFIVKPIDSLVELGMDQTIRTKYKHVE
uniref:Mitochondrial fission process protein 1 n=1 Tax=Rhabditophanes sp. KR3021 TaxID=114890 RepID=A0AC35TWR0_9BILA